MKSHGIKSHRFQVSKFANLFFFVLSLMGCAYFGFVTYYDPTTYKNLTDLKPEVTTFYETFTGDSIDSGRLAAIRLRLAQVYEYKKGKGSKNSETTRQIQILQGMFERHVNERINMGKWTLIQLNNQKQNIAEAFDIAIETERLKNKNE